MYIYIHIREQCLRYDTCINTHSKIHTYMHVIYIHTCIHTYEQCLRWDIGKVPKERSPCLNGTVSLIPGTETPESGPTVMPEQIRVCS